MRIAFIVIGNSRRSAYLNGDSIRTGGGGASGTDGSNILVAEYLATQGYECVIATEKLEPQLEELYKSKGIFPPEGDSIRGVRYTDIEFTGIDNLEFDFVISNLWFSEYSKLPLKVTKGVIYWSHMQWLYGVHEVTEYANSFNVPLGLVNISKWEKEMNFSHFEHFYKQANKFFTTIIPNPVADDIIKEVEVKKKKGKFVFHAAWARGGNVAIDAVRKIDLPHKEFHAFDYLMATHAHKDDFFIMHNGVDKKTLFSHLAEAEYFFYPLYTPYQDVHKDTFSCVVAEAIALGTLPVTYPLGALPEYYSGYCSWLNPPINPLDMQNESLSKDYDGLFNNSEAVKNKFDELEKNPTSKQHVQANGKKYILDNFSVDVVGEKWINLLRRF